MNCHILTESLTAALNDLPPDTRQRILDKFVAEVLKRDERQAKIHRAAKMKQAKVPYREICKALGLSMRDVVSI